MLNKKVLSSIEKKSSYDKFRLKIITDCNATIFKNF